MLTDNIDRMLTRAMMNTQNYKSIKHFMKKLLLVIVVILVVFFAWKAVQAPESVQEAMKDQTGPIKIGFVAPLTGDASSLGVPAKKAVELAVKEFNAAGGINGKQVELIAEDGQCDSKTASNAGAKLITVDKVNGIVGGFCSGESSAFGPSAMTNKVVMISPVSSAPALSNLGKYFFRVYPSDLFQGKFAAEYVYNTLKVKKVAVVWHVSDWGNGVKDVFVSRFKELGGTIVLEEGANTKDRDYRTVIGKVRTSGAELLYIPTYPEGGTAFLQQVKDIGLKMKILGADAWGDTKLQGAVSASLGAQYIEPKSTTPPDFETKFKAAYPEDKIALGTLQAYDAANILLNAIKKAGTNPDAIADAVRATRVEGTSGPISFDEHGDITVANYVVKNLLGEGKTSEVK